MTKEDAGNLIHALTFGSPVVDVPVDLAEVIASGKLDPVLEYAEQRMTGRLAYFDRSEPYWRVERTETEAAIKARDPKTTWRSYKAEHPEVFGIDGDDLYVMYQVIMLTAELGHPVTLATGDFHLAHAAREGGICRTLLYSRDGDNVVSEFLEPRTWTKSEALYDEQEPQRRPSIRPRAGSPAARSADSTHDNGKHLSTDRAGRVMETI